MTSRLGLCQLDRTLSRDVTVARHGPYALVATTSYDAPPYYELRKGERIISDAAGSGVTALISTYNTLVGACGGRPVTKESVAGAMHMEVEATPRGNAAGRVRAWTAMDGAPFYEVSRDGRVEYAGGDPEAAVTAYNGGRALTSAPGYGG